MKRKYVACMGLAVALILAGGCTRIRGPRTDTITLVEPSDEGTSPGVRVPGTDTEPRLNRVGFLQRDLSKKIAVEQTGATRTATNTLEVYAVFRNRTKYDQQIQVRTQYFGSVREPNEGPHEWQVVFLPPNGIETYRTNSRGTTAAYYYIEVQGMP